MSLFLSCATVAVGADPRTDAHGDPLPPFAVARLGTVRWRAPLRAESGFSQVCFSPDGRIVASVGGSGLLLWDASSGKLTAGSPEVRYPGAAVFSADGQSLLVETAGAGGVLSRDPPVAMRALQRWEVGTSKLLAETSWPRTLDLLRLAVFSADGRRLVFNDREKKVRLWDTTRGESLRDFDHELPMAWSLALSATGDRLALVDKQRKLWLFDTASGQELRQFPIEEGYAPWMGYSDPALSPDGKTLAAVTPDHLRVWDAATGKVLKEIAGCRGPLAFSPDGKLLAGCGPQAIRLWDVPSLREVRTFEEHHDSIGGLAFSADGKRLATAQTGTVNVWDVATGQLLTPSPGHHKGIAALAFSPKGDRLASGGYDGLAIVWDVSTRKALHRLPGHVDCVASLAFSVDGQVLATGDGSKDGFDSREAQIRLWDADAGRLAGQFTGHLHGVRSMQFSPDGQRLATSGGDARARVWDVGIGQRQFQVRVAGRPKSVEFSPDGRALLVASEGGLTLWRVDDGQHLSDIGPQDSKYLRQVEAIRFIGNGQGFWSLEHGERNAEGFELPPRFHFWSTATGREERSLVVMAMKGRGYRIHAVSPDNKTIAIADRERVGHLEWPVVRLWDVESGKRLATLHGHTQGVTALAFSPDGKTLATGSGDTTVLFWDVSQARFQARWDDLANEAEAAALPAEADPVGAARFLRERLARIAAAEAEARKWIASLDADDFAAREKATQELDRLPAEADFTLRLALESDPSPETRQRLRRALDRRKEELPAAPSFEPVQVRRAVTLLEKIDRPEARAALEELTKGPADAVVTREARAALDRLTKPGPKP